MQMNLHSITSVDINMICKTIGEIFTKASNETFLDVNIKTADKNNISKRWFGYQCQNARRKYHLARKINNINPSETNRNNLKAASKTYTRTMNFYINKHNKITQDKLRVLKSKNPKDFWKIINSIEKSKDNQNIDIEILYDFFKNLNEQNEDSINEDLNLCTNDDDEILNSFITEGEILKCIKSLKSNESSSNDKIINEYIKYTSHIMLPVYVSFFNIVFDTGIIPESWLEGIIQPIYKNNGDPKLPENYRQ